MTLELSYDISNIYGQTWWNQYTPYDFIVGIKADIQHCVIYNIHAYHSKDLLQLALVTDGRRCNVRLFEWI